MIFTNPRIISKMTKFQQPQCALITNCRRASLLTQHTAERFDSKHAIVLHDRISERKHQIM